jgi:hypothetical protein
MSKGRYRRSRSKPHGHGIIFGRDFRKNLKDILSIPSS